MFRVCSALFFLLPPARPQRSPRPPNKQTPTNKTRQKQIVVARAFSHEHQSDLLVSLAAKMVEEPFRLLIVDSVW